MTLYRPSDLADLPDDVAEALRDHHRPSDLPDLPDDIAEALHEHYLHDAQSVEYDIDEDGVMSVTIKAAGSGLITTSAVPATVKAVRDMINRIISDTSSGWSDGTKPIDRLADLVFGEAELVN